MLLRIILALAGLGICLGAVAAEAVVGKITRYGIYEMVGPAQGPWRVGSVTETTRIPARTGLRFGIDFEVSGISRASARVIAKLYHPTMTKPDGSRTSASVNTMGPFDVVDGRFASSFGFTFDHAHEMLPGEWRAEVSYQGRVVAEQTFIVEADSAAN